MVYTWRHNLTVAWNQDPDNDLTDDFFPPMAEQLQDQLSGPIERGYRQNRQVLVVLESLGESQMKQHDYRGAIDTGRALIELVYPFEGLCMIGDAAWALGRAYEAIDYYEEAREALLEGAGARPLERVQQRIAAVQAYLAKRKDPVTTLPEEVCQRIFSHLEWQQDRTTCARVSTLWRDRVLGAPIWKTLHLSLVNGVEQRIPPDELERYLQPQLQNVHIVSHGGVEALLEKLERNGCTQLKKMTITAPRYPRLLSNPCLNSLKAISDHLVDLHLRCPGVNEPLMMLELLLQCCPSLRCFQFKTMGPTNFDLPCQPSGSARSQCMSLRSLYGPKDISSLRAVDEQHLLKTLCPNLKHLFLETKSSDMVGADIAPYIDHLRELPLETLVIGQDEDVFPCCGRDKDGLAESAIYRSSHDAMALKRLVISNVKISHATLRELLMESQRTLEEVLVVANGIIRGRVQEEDNVRWDFPQLARATIWQDIPTDFDAHAMMQDEAIPAAIQPLDVFLYACPVLESLTLQFTNLDPVCVDALCRIKHLELSQEGRHILDRTADALLELARHPQSAIEHLTLTVQLNPRAYETLFIELGQMPRLCQLSYFHGSADAGINRSTLEAFIARAQQSGLTDRLTELRFQGKGETTESCIKDTFFSLTEIEIRNEQ